MNSKTAQNRAVVTISAQAVDTIHVFQAPQAHGLEGLPGELREEWE